MSKYNSKEELVKYITSEEDLDVSILFEKYENRYKSSLKKLEVFLLGEEITKEGVKVFIDRERNCYFFKLLETKKFCKYILNLINENTLTSSTQKDVHFIYLLTQVINNYDFT